ncbi:MAG: coniferyl aldehyde dehydrogenase [Novosphingobium sp.]
MADGEAQGADMRALLDAQRRAFDAARPEPLAARRDRLDRCLGLMLDNLDPLCAAMSADFGNRSREQSLLSDLLPTVNLAKYCRRHFARWARTERRSAGFPLAWIGGRAEVRYEPKGVVGILSPWNFPVGLSLGPLVQALAAGNRVMLKPSEITPRTSALLAELFAARFAPEEVTVVLGDPEVAQAFTALPFDHLLFTGATAVGRHVLHAAADNLVPTTLELGGKSPAIVGRSADLARAARRIAAGKMMNAGQICLAPDYLLVPEDREEETIAAIGKAVAVSYPTLLANDDYTAIINARHRDRLLGLIDDAVAKGAEAVEINPGSEVFAAGNVAKLPLTILRRVNDGMKVMQQEIFGPVLPVKTYRGIDEAIDYMNAHPRPLALYYFGEDAAEQERVLARGISGGVTVNDILFHITVDALPFGGIGASGMGHYHGPEGFRTFSHARAIYRQPRIDIAGLAGLRPPYGGATRRTIAMLLRR